MGRRPAGRWYKTWREKILRRDPFVRLDSYGAEFSREQKIINLKNSTRVYHRSISAYIRAGLSAGFALKDISELTPMENDLAEFGQPLFLTKFPAVLALVLVKPRAD